MGILWLDVCLQTACNCLKLQRMVILRHDTAGISSPVPASFILLPGWPGKPFKQGTPTSAVQLESVRQPPYRTWDTIILNWSEKGRMDLQMNPFKNRRSTMIPFTDDFPQWKQKVAWIDVRRERQGEPTRVLLFQYSEERKIVNSPKSLSRKRSEGHYSIKGNQVS